MSPALRQRLAAGGSAALAALLLIWTLLPIYNIFLIALDPEEGEIEFTGNIVPSEISFDGFADAVSGEARYLEHFWEQLANSLLIGVGVVALTLAVASLAGFAVGRMRLGRGTWLVTAALVTYAVPATFLIFPFNRVMQFYGLTDNLWAVILTQVAFASPFAVLILLQYAKLVPIELDEAARIDGASAPQVYLRVYLPTMAPPLAIVALYALLLAWNDYVYQFVLLFSPGNTTVAMIHSQLFVDTDAPWNAMMAAAVIYVLPPIALCLALRRYLLAGLRLGG